MGFSQAQLPPLHVNTMASLKACLRLELLPTSPRAPRAATWTRCLSGGFLTIPSPLCGNIAPQPASGATRALPGRTPSSASGTAFKDAPEESESTDTLQLMGVTYTPSANGHTP